MNASFCHDTQSTLIIDAVAEAMAGVDHQGSATGPVYDSLETSSKKSENQRRKNLCAECDHASSDRVFVLMLAKHAE